MLKKHVGLFLTYLFCGFLTLLNAQTPAKPSASPGPSFEPKALPSEDSVVVTLILKHQQNKNLPEIRRVLEAQGFWDMFPPKECRVLSWTLAMGLGHVIVLQVPVSGVRRLNLAVENGAWGAFDTEFYLSYDYKIIWEEYLERREAARDDRN
ncbi:MAG: hypothetical protein RMJ33_03880 [Saprospiraceae bacterium]|nr:hypothetical protein [Saprospiraceae bacterium]MDW8228960.1 hypothetical protein [Saprospiraceae bacterium]